jgi:hypothetical protein
VGNERRPAKRRDLIRVVVGLLFSGGWRNRPQSSNQINESEMQTADYLGSNVNATPLMQ